MPMGAPNPDDRTQSWDLDRQPTLSWSLERKWPAALYVGAGAAGAICACLVGFWIGRASAPPARTPTIESAATQPVQLPVPPATDPQLVSPQAAAMPQHYAQVPRPGTPDSTDTRGSTTPRVETPVVTVRPRPIPPPRTTAVPIQPVYPRSSPPTVVYSQSGPARQSVTVMRAPAPAPLETTVPSNDASLGGLARPDGTRAVVMIRNDDAAPVDVVIEGQGTRTAMIAPGTSLPLTLGAGSYQLRANGRGASSIRSTLALAANRTYRLVVSRREQDGREVLVLIEPAIDDQPG